MTTGTSKPDTSSDETTRSLTEDGDCLQVQQLLSGPAGSLLSEMFRRDMSEARLSTIFKVFYRFRPFMPIVVRQLIQRWRTGQVARNEGTHDESRPGIEVFMPEKLLSNRDVLPSISPWPNQAEFALVLTHDVETRDGVQRMSRLAEIEESFGFRSCWNIVPYKYKTDQGLLQDLRQRGHEIGVHGFNHDGRLFASKKIFDRRVAGINEAIEELGAVGFRAPMVHRNMHWLQALNVDYDSSCFDVDPFQAMPGGIGSFWPSIVGRFVELPYTMPQDHTLLVSLNQTDDAVWRWKLGVIRDCHGMSLMLTHPDYLDSASRLSIYRDFLAYLKDNTAPWHVLPREMATWTRQQLNLRQATL